jgi:hypothetical protein
VIAPALLILAVLLLDCACVAEKVAAPITNNMVSVIVLAFMDTPTGG